MSLFLVNSVGQPIRSSIIEQVALCVMSESNDSEIDGYTDENRGSVGSEAMKHLQEYALSSGKAHPKRDGSLSFMAMRFNLRDEQERSVFAKALPYSIQASIKDHDGGTMIESDDSGDTFEVNVSEVLKAEIDTMLRTEFNTSFAALFKPSVR